MPSDPSSSLSVPCAKAVIAPLGVFRALPYIEGMKHLNRRHFLFLAALVPLVCRGRRGRRFRAGPGRRGGARPIFCFCAARSSSLPTARTTLPLSGRWSCCRATTAETGAARCDPDRRHRSRRTRPTLRKRLRPRGLFAGADGQGLESDDPQAPAMGWARDRQRHRQDSDRAVRKSLERNPSGRN